MKALAIRYWLVLALAVFFISAVSPFVVIGAVICAKASPPKEAVKYSSLVSTNAARWTDPGWQAELGAKLPANVSVVLLDAAGRELFREGKPPADPTPAGYTQVMVMDGARLVGVADLYDVSPCGGDIYGRVAFPISLLVQVLVGLGIAGVLNRYVLRPLAGMSQAAVRIADGNLDFQIPPSRVREVADVAAAFHAMGEALRGSLTRQSQLELDRRFFISAIAHDLRTPLFALRGHLSGLEKGLASTPEKTAHYIAVCQEKADALERLIADLFAYSRLEYLEQPIQRAPLDFSRLVAKTSNDIRLRAEERDISVRVEGGSEPCEVQGDESFLARALDNLLDNALRYTPDGGEIELRWSKEGHLLRFTIADSGPGIADSDLPHVFDPLYRGETSRNRQTGGAGLGLTIARRILQAHGGDLVAANRPGGGAEFTGTFREGREQGTENREP